MKKYTYICDFNNTKDLIGTKYDTKRVSLVGSCGEKLTEMQNYLNDFLKEIKMTRDGNRNSGKIVNVVGETIGNYQLVSETVNI